VQRDVTAVVPTYAPEPGSLHSLLEALVAQVPTVLVTNDASPCTADTVLAELAGFPEVTVVRHDHNAGIARGLNEGLVFAAEQGSAWLLTVDQDSELPASYVDHLVQEAQRLVAADMPLGVIGAGRIDDGSGPLSYPVHDLGIATVTEEVIQTGSLWSVAALAKAGGFDESLGIDAVDAAACLRLREAGYLVAVAPELHIRHSIGRSRIVRVLGRDVMVTGHSPSRRATMLRNRLRLFPAEFRQSPRHAFRTIRRVAANQMLGLLVEDDRWAKAKGSIRGLGLRRNR
jgi:rhamnosyltransferase